jgi:hypothetical protein
LILQHYSLLAAIQKMRYTGSSARGTAMFFHFEWKLIGGDAFSQVWEGADFHEAFERFFNFWEITPDDCEIFDVTERSHPEIPDGEIEC